MSSSIILPRVLLVILLGTAIVCPSIFQSTLDCLWGWLHELRIYQASTFETAWTVLVYAIVEPIYTYRFAHNPQLRLAVLKNGDPSKPLPKLQRPSKRVREGITYIIPLLAMDLTMIKKFHGVSVHDMAVSGNYDPGTVGMHGTFLVPTLHRFTLQSPLQTRRALPLAAPTSRQLVIQLITSILIYDTVFFLFHLALHQIPGLHRIHNVHHGHAEINPQITNQLDIVERIGLVLLANFSLNIIGSHVLTRTLFVPMFVWLLVDIHSGLNLPWSYDKLLPQGWAAGSARHSYHHQHGSMFYEPFFNWWDDFYGLMYSKRTKDVE